MIIKNSIITRIQGNIDPAKENLAVYMSINRLYDAASACSNMGMDQEVLASNGKCEAQIISIHVDSDSATELENAALLVLEELETILKNGVFNRTSYGVGVSSFEGKDIGYDIFIVLVY